MQKTMTDRTLSKRLSLKKLTIRELTPKEANAKSLRSSAVPRDHDCRHSPTKWPSKRRSTEPR
jgi:hypothetical protein